MIFGGEFLNTLHYIWNVQIRNNKVSKMLYMNQMSYKLNKWSKQKIIDWPLSYVLSSPSPKSSRPRPNPKPV